MTGKLRTNPRADAYTGLAAGSQNDNGDSRKGKWKEFKTGLVLQDWVHLWISCSCKTQRHTIAQVERYTSNLLLIDCPIFGVHWFWGATKCAWLADIEACLSDSCAHQCANASFNLTCTIMWTSHQPAVNMFVRNLERIRGILCPERILVKLVGEKKYQFRCDIILAIWFKIINGCCVSAVSPASRRYFSSYKFPYELLNFNHRY